MLAYPKASAKFQAFFMLSGCVIVTSKLPDAPASTKICNGMTSENERT